MAKLLILTGPTAVGKTALGIKLAKKYHGEIVSADSRQVYKGMDIGTGKDIYRSKVKSQKSEIKFKNKNFSSEFYEVEEVRVWGLDVVEPDYPFNVADYREYATGVIEDIWGRGVLPIVVGGTGLYVKALLEPMEMAAVRPDQGLRRELQGETLERLQERLLGWDKDRWERMNQSDRQNSRRLVRAIEIAKQRRRSKIDGPLGLAQGERKDVLIISLGADRDYLYGRIDRRVEERMKRGMVGEIKELRQKGYSWDLPSMTAIGYREFKGEIKGTKDRELREVISRWKYGEHAYARRQVTFLKKFVGEQEKKGSGVLCVDVSEKGWQGKVGSGVRRWKEFGSVPPAR